jgi:hypothetical protein
VFTKNSDYEGTPSNCSEWMRAIDDTLDGEVDEVEYTNTAIQELFCVIEKDKITPVDRACMKDQYSREEACLKAFEDGMKQGWNEKIVGNLKALGTMTDEQIASATGLSLEIVKAL